MFIRRFFVVSCIASGIVLCIWLSYKKVFYFSIFSQSFDNYVVERNNGIEKNCGENSDEIDSIQRKNAETDNEWLNEQKYSMSNDGEIKNRDEVLFELVIPSINLRKKVYTIGSSLNDVDKNVEILDNSNINMKLFYLASHSGGGVASYFDKLVYLEIGDIVWLYGNDLELGFVVKDIFYISKNGYFEASYGSDGNVLFLITCSLEYVGKQLIVKADLVYGS